MTQETINKALQKTLISPLTYDLLWSQFLEANSYEISNMRNRYYDISNNDISNIPKAVNYMYKRLITFIAINK